MNELIKITLKIIVVLAIALGIGVGLANAETSVTFKEINKQGNWSYVKITERDPMYDETVFYTVQSTSEEGITLRWMGVEGVDLMVLAISTPANIEITSTSILTRVDKDVPIVITPLLPEPFFNEKETRTVTTDSLKADLVELYVRMGTGKKLVIKLDVVDTNNYSKGEYEMYGVFNLDGCLPALLWLNEAVRPKN